VQGDSLVMNRSTSGLNVRFDQKDIVVGDSQKSLDAEIAIVPTSPPKSPQTQTPILHPQSQPRAELSISPHGTLRQGPWPSLTIDTDPSSEIDTYKDSDIDMKPDPRHHLKSVSMSLTRGSSHRQLLGAVGMGSMGSMSMGSMGMGMGDIGTKSIAQVFDADGSALTHARASLERLVNNQDDDDDGDDLGTSELEYGGGCVQLDGEALSCFLDDLCAPKATSDVDGRIAKQCGERRSGVLSRCVQHCTLLCLHLQPFILTPHAHPSHPLHRLTLTVSHTLAVSHYPLPTTRRSHTSTLTHPPLPTHPTTPVVPCRRTPSAPTPRWACAAATRRPSACAAPWKTSRTAAAAA
jgi:hypothetical protein